MRYMTSRTDDSRAGRCWLSGVSNGTCARPRVFLARTMRWAIVGSGSR